MISFTRERKDVDHIPSYSFKPPTYNRQSHTEKDYTLKKAHMFASSTTLWLTDRLIILSSKKKKNIAQFSHKQ